MNAQSKPKMKLWLRSVLAVSLGLNLAIAGLAIGAAIRFQNRDGMRPAPSFGAILFRELDHDTRKALRQQAGGDHGSYKDRRRAESGRVLALLRASPFEIEALTEFLQGQVQSRQNFHSMVQHAWLTRVSAMSDAERANYAEDLQQQMHRPHRSRHSWRRRSEAPSPD